MFSGFTQLTPMTSVGSIMAGSYIITTCATELYLHRSRSHRSIMFHPLLCQASSACGSS